MNRRMPMLPYTRFSRVSPAHYTAKGEIYTPFCNRFTDTFTGACGGLIMYALTAHVVLRCCPLRIGTSRANSSGFGYRSRLRCTDYRAPSLH